MLAAIFLLQGNKMTTNFMGVKILVRKKITGEKMLKKGCGLKNRRNFFDGRKQC